MSETFAQSSARLHQILDRMDVVRRRLPGSRPMAECEALFDEAIAKLAEDDYACPMGAVAKTHPLYSEADGCRLVLGCDLLGWNSDQGWAFVSAFDGDLDKKDRFIDPRETGFAEIVALGKKFREKYAQRRGQ